MTTLIKNFDPVNKEHVLWLQKIDAAMVALTNNERKDLDKIVNSNPITETKIEMLDWAYVHFQLALKYSQGVLRGNAFIPTTFL